MREVCERDCNQATNLLLKIEGDEITTDSEVLDGKKWDEFLDIKFKDLDVSPFPVAAPTLYDSTDSPSISPQVLENSTETLQGCQHTWVVYQGAGTRPPETICQKCGIPSATP